MVRNHVVISGTGRAGTAFLVELLTHLGLDTGFDVDAIELSPLPRAGLETDIRVAVVFETKDGLPNIAGVERGVRCPALRGLVQRHGVVQQNN